MFLITQLFKEAKHVEWLDRWFVEAAGGTSSALDGAASAPYRASFDEALPAALSCLLRNDSQVETIATYHSIIEGVLAETGYYGRARPARPWHPARHAARGWRRSSATRPATSPMACVLLGCLIETELALREALMPGSRPAVGAGDRGRDLRALLQRHAVWPLPC
jgi:hypothetical protein